jgi:hypothetical protein
VRGPNYLAHFAVGRGQTFVAIHFLRRIRFPKKSIKGKSFYCSRKLRALAKEKQGLWRNHHQQTIAMISEIAGELILKTIDLYKKQAI